MDRYYEGRSEQENGKVRYYDDRYNSNEIRFTLLAVTKSKSANAEQQITTLRREKASYLRALEAVEGQSFDKTAFADYEQCVEFDNLAKHLDCWRNGF